MLILDVMPTSQAAGGRYESGKLAAMREVLANCGEKPHRVVVLVAYDFTMAQISPQVGRSRP